MDSAHQAAIVRQILANRFISHGFSPLDKRQFLRNCDGSDDGRSKKPDPLFWFVPSFCPRCPRPVKNLKLLSCQTRMFDLVWAVLPISQAGMLKGYSLRWS
jgi:hypothetical protein